MISLPKMQAACPSSVAQAISVTMGKILKSTELLSRHLSTEIRGYATQFPILSPVTFLTCTCCLCSNFVRILVAFSGEFQQSMF